MKRLFYFLIVLSCTLWNCGGDDKGVDDPNNPDNPDNPTNVTLEISISDLTFEAKGGQKEFTIYCNSDWTITNNSTWCKTDVPNGNGNKTITITATPYSETEDQNTNLTIKAGDKTKVLTITQKHGDAIILTKDKFDVPQEGDNITIEVKSNIEYQVSIPSQFQSWIKEAVKSKALETKNFSFTISVNENLDKREGYIVFSGNSLKDTICIYQAQKNQLILTKDTYNIPAEGKNVTVELKTNIDYDVIIPDSVSNWISLIQTKAIRTDKLNFSIAKNENTDNRKAIVIIKDKNSLLSDTLCINQLQKNALILTQKKYDIKVEGETISVELKSNIQYDVIIPDSVSSWIKNIQTKTLKTDKLQFSILANDTYSNRQAVIIFKDKTTSLADTLKIKQTKKNVLILTQKNYTVKGEGEDISIKLESNIEYDVVIPQEVMTWISLIKNRTLITDILKLNIKANNESKNRFAKIVIEDKNSDLSDTIYITQSLQDTYIGNVIFSTIEEVKSFQQDGYKRIDGNVIIQKGNITTLSNLNNQLEEITGNLTIDNPYLQNLDGFYGLKCIKGDLVLKNATITSFEGLNNLEKIEQNFEISCSTTTSSLNALTSFKGLSKLSTIGGNFKIIATSPSSITSFSSLNALTSFEGLENLISIGGDFEIKALYYSSLNALTSFKGLSKLSTIGGDFKIIATAGSSSPLNALTSFEGLENLISIGGDFEISTSSFYNPSPLTAFTSFKGLSKLGTIGGHFKVSDSSNSLKALTSFEGLENLTNINGDFAIDAHSSSYPFLNALTSFKGLSKLSTIGGHFKIGATSFSSLNALTSFEGLENLISIGGDFEIKSYSTTSLTSYSSLNALTSFKGLSKLGTIEGNFKINATAFFPSSSYSNATTSSLNALTSFEGLENLISIGGDFEINASSSSYTSAFPYSYSLNTLTSFKGLSKLSTIGGNFKISATASNSNSLNALTSFEGLENLININGDFEINAIASGRPYSLNTLTSFKGLSKLSTIGGNFLTDKGLYQENGLESLTSVNGDMMLYFKSTVFFNNLQHVQSANLKV